MILEAKGVSFRYPYREKQILNRVDITVASGERVGLLAPSGYGKTTLCKILAGFEKPDEGTLLLDSQPLNSFGRYCPVQMIWQSPELAVNPRLKMHRILAEGGRVNRRIVKKLGIEDAWLTRYPAELSGGELQRFCIARALGEDTKFLLADEITTMLDLITQGQIWEFLLEETTLRNIGLLVISHSPALIGAVCTRTQAL